MNNTQKGIDVVLKIGETVLAGQLNATLNQTMFPIDITNKIKGEWKKSLGGIKQWSIACEGMYVKNAETYALLQTAFNNNTLIDVEVIMDTHRYTGKALLTEFPIISSYNSTSKYKVRLLGDGELVLSE